MSTRHHNPWPESPRGFREILRWKSGLGPQCPHAFPHAESPAATVPLNQAQLLTNPPASWLATWLGHAGFLLAGHHTTLLIDPVFSSHCSPLPFPSFRRLAPPPCAMTDLPRPDAILLTHHHYDHCDLPTLRQLGRDIPLIVPAGLPQWLRRKGFPNATELPWWQQLTLPNGITITATPARHFSARSPFDRNETHWCGFHIQGPGGSLWHTGDSGYCDAFREIPQRLGPIDFAMIPIGAYNPRWFMQEIHMNPPEAVQAFLDAQCHRAIGMHWGTFRLTDEPPGEPPLLLAQSLHEHALDPSRFFTAPIGSQHPVQPAHRRAPSPTTP